MRPNAILFLMLPILALSAFTYQTAKADLVTGKIAKGPFRAQLDTCLVIASDSTIVKRFVTNKKREYQVILAPGTYRVGFRDKNGQEWIAMLRAELTTVKDISIAFKKGKLIK